MLRRRFKSYAASLKGKKEHNEDAYKSDDSRGLYIIADGLTGYEPDSAKFAVEMLYPNLKAAVRWRDSKIASHQTGTTLDYVSKQMYRESQLRNRVGKMGTTLDIVMLLDTKLYVAHIGDSRVYILNSDNELVQVTRDDSEVQDRVERGMIEATEAKFSPDYYRLTRRFGGKRDAVFSEYEHDLGDIRKILLSTDGLTDVTLDSRIQEIITRDKPVREIVEELVSCYCNPGKDTVDSFLKYSNLPVEWIDDSAQCQRWLLQLSDNGKSEEVARLKKLRNELSLVRRPGVQHEIVQGSISKDEIVRGAYQKRAADYLSERDNCTIILVENMRFT